MKIPVLLILFALVYYLDGRKEEESFEEKVEARNELKSYLYSLKNKVVDMGELRKFGAKLLDIDVSDKKSYVYQMDYAYEKKVVPWFHAVYWINKKIKWLEDNQDKEASEFKRVKKEFENNFMFLESPITNYQFKLGIIKLLKYLELLALEDYMDSTFLKLYQEHGGASAEMPKDEHEWDEL
ncbi:endoplasmic reticulum chaperone BiP-like [Artemia franciscana]